MGRMKEDRKVTGVCAPQTLAQNTSNPGPKPPSRRPVAAAPRERGAAAAAAGAGDAVGPQVGSGVRGAATPRQAGLRRVTAHQDLVPTAAVAAARSQAPCSGGSSPTPGAAEGGSARHMLAPPGSIDVEAPRLASPIHLNRFGSCRLPTIGGPGFALLGLPFGCADTLVAPPPGACARALWLSHSDGSPWRSLPPHGLGAISGPHSVPPSSWLHAPIAAGAPACAGSSFGRGSAAAGAVGTTTQQQQQPLWLPRRHSGSGGVPESCGANAPTLQQGTHLAGELDAGPWGLPLGGMPSCPVAGVAHAASLCSGLQPHLVAEDIGNDNSDLEARLDSQLFYLLQQRQHMLLTKDSLGKRAAAAVAGGPTSPGMVAPALMTAVPCSSQLASSDGSGPLLGNARGAAAQLLGAALPRPVAPPPLSSTAARAAAQAKLEQLATVKQMQEMLELELELLQLLS